MGLEEFGYKGDDHDHQEGVTMIRRCLERLQAW